MGYVMDIIVHWFALLNIQSDWLLSPMGSTIDSTCWIGQKAANKGRQGLTSASSAGYSAKTWAKNTVYL